VNIKWENISPPIRENPYFFLKIIIMCITKQLIGDADSMHLAVKVGLK